MYYVRFEDGTIDGPYPIDHIRSLVEKGELTSEAGVVEDRGQGDSSAWEHSEWKTVSQLLAGSIETNQTKASPLNQPAPVSPLVKRYKDAYRVGAALKGLGDTIKVVGLILAVLVLFGALSFLGGPLGTVGLVLGGFVAAIVFALFWACGVLAAAQGQIIQATLDSAVSQTPFLSDRERLEAMGLSTTLARRTVDN